MRTARSLAFTACAQLPLLMQLSCAGGQGAPEPPVQKETAQDEITRIAHTWTSTAVQKSLLSPPSPVSLETTSRRSQLTLSATGLSEVLEVREVLELRNGQTVHCSLRFEHELERRFGRKHGEAALEVVRPALSRARSCDSPPPVSLFSEPARRALLVLRADQLVVVEPPLDDRTYRPMGP